MTPDQLNTALEAGWSPPCGADLDTRLAVEASYSLGEYNAALAAGDQPRAVNAANRWTVTTAARYRRFAAFASVQLQFQLQPTTRRP